MKFLFWILFFSMIFAEDFRIKVGVSLAPYAYFVQKIGGDFVKVDVLIPQQRNPKSYDLSYEQVKIIKDLRLLIGAGAFYEKKWFDRLKNANPSLWILQTKDESCTEEMCYIWLNLQNVAKIAKEIAYVLRMIDLKNAQNYKKNLDLFLEEIEMLDREIKQKITPNQKEFFAYQSGWKSFAEEFGVELILWRNKKQTKKPYLLTPFDPKQQMINQLSLSKRSFEEINPFAYEWKEVLLQLSDFISTGDKNGK